MRLFPSTVVTSPWSDRRTPGRSPSCRRASTDLPDHDRLSIPWAGVPVTTILPSSGDALLAPAGVLRVQPHDHVPPRRASSPAGDDRGLRPQSDFVANAETGGSPTRSRSCCPMRRATACGVAASPPKACRSRTPSASSAISRMTSPVPRPGHGVQPRPRADRPGRLYPSVTAVGWDAWLAVGSDPPIVVSSPSSPPRSRRTRAPSRLAARHRSASVARRACPGRLGRPRRYAPATAATAVVTGATTTDRGSPPWGAARTANPVVAPGRQSPPSRPYPPRISALGWSTPSPDWPASGEPTWPFEWALDTLGATPRPQRMAMTRKPRMAASNSGPVEGDPRAPMARAVLQLTSRAESSLVVDAADLYRLPRRSSPGSATMPRAICCGPCAGRHGLAAARGAPPRAGAHRPRSRRRAPRRAAGRRRPPSSRARASRCCGRPRSWPTASSCARR